jgi:cytochrome P450
VAITYPVAGDLARGDPPDRVGGLAALRVAADVAVDPVRGMVRTHERYGPFTEFVVGAPDAKLGSRYVYAVGAPYNERVLSDPVAYHPCGVMLPGPKGSAQRRIRNGLLTARGPHHTHYRRLMLPPLRRAAVDQQAAKMGQVVERLAEQWPVGQPVDLYPLVSQVALHVSLETLFPDEGGCEHQEALNAANLMNDHFRMNASLAVKACPIDAPGLPYHRMMRNAETIETALAAWARRHGDVKRTDSLLSILAHSPDEKGAPPTEATISGHLITLFGASYETSQSSLAWALFLLAQHPDAAARLLDELEALPENGRAFEDQIGDCVWLDAVVKEALRILPPVPIQMRRAGAQTDLGDRRVEAGAYVVLSPFLTNRDPDLYPDPAAFRPERWTSINPSQYEYLVFSAGPRLCIGARFAVTFLKVAIAHIVKRYRIQVTPGVRIDQSVGLTMTPVKTGVPVTFHAQDGRFQASPVRGNIRQIIDL